MVSKSLTKKEFTQKALEHFDNLEQHHIDEEYEDFESGDEFDLDYCLVQLGIISIMKKYKIYDIPNKIVEHNWNSICNWFLKDIDKFERLLTNYWIVTFPNGKKKLYEYFHNDPFFSEYVCRHDGKVTIEPVVSLNADTEHLFRPRQNPGT